MTPDTYEELYNLYGKLLSLWDKHTAFNNDDLSDFPEYGQCLGTSLIINERFGGVIVQCWINGGISHHWNILPSGESVDLTRGQFTFWIQETGQTKVTREEILQDPDTERRYRILHQRLEDLEKDIESDWR